MQSKAAKEQRLVKTMKSFFKTREDERCCLINGEMPPKQKKVMDSIIKQAVALRANVEFSGDAPLHGAASAGTQGYASGDEK